MESRLSPENAWYSVSNVSGVNSPALLVYPDRIENNIRKMISMAGGTGRLRPHVKTHKMPEVIRLQLKHGISKFKCATIAEAEMAAESGAGDILLAYQPVGPNILRLFNLKGKYPGTKISCIADCNEIVMELSEAAVRNKTVISIFLDINVGMNRTGIKPGKPAAELFRVIANSPNVRAEGIHVYDGHLHQKDYSLREKLCNEAYEKVESFLSLLSEFHDQPLTIVAGGSPSFPVHAKRPEVETSPGTVLLWDFGYSSSYADMDFQHAAVLLTRVVSKPGDDLVCIDLGHKAVGSEMPPPRIRPLNLESFEFVSHNEEHMVLRTSEAARLKVGDVLYALPFHICPTVDRFDFVSVVREGKVKEEWKVEARKRRITI